jgi:hypothetical protein
VINFYKEKDMSVDEKIIIITYVPSVSPSKCTCIRIQDEKYNRRTLSLLPLEAVWF